MKNEMILITRSALLGDKNAFGELVVFYQSPIRRFLLNLTGGDEELCKDLAQETFIKAWLQIATFRGSSKFSTWLYRIAYNVFYDTTRRKSSIVANTEAMQQAPPENTVQSHDFQMDFYRIIGKLNEKERVVMLLFYMEDLSISTIRKITGMPAGTIKSYLSRGKKKLAQELKEHKY